MTLSHFHMLTHRDKMCVIRVWLGPDMGVEDLGHLKFRISLKNNKKYENFIGTPFNTKIFIIKNLLGLL